MSWRNCADDRPETIRSPKRLTGIWSAEIRELVQTTVDRIVIHHDGIEVTLKVKEMDRAIDGDNQSQQPNDRQACSSPSPSP